MRPDGLIGCNTSGCTRTVNIHRYGWEGAQDAGWSLSGDGPIGDPGVDHCPDHAEETP